MEKFYIVTPKAEIHGKAAAYEDYVKRFCEAFNAFAKKHGIESHQAYPMRERLSFVPTSADKEKFKDHFMKDDETTFKKTSPINKAWVEAAEAIGDRVLDPRLYLPAYFGYPSKSSSRLFPVGETLYCTFQSETPFDTPDGFEELKASEFYRRMEEAGIEIG